MRPCLKNQATTQENKWLTESSFQTARTRMRLDFTFLNKPLSSAATLENLRVTSFPLLTTNSNSPILLAWYSLDGTVWNTQVENNHPFLLVDLLGQSQRVRWEHLLIQEAKGSAKSPSLPSRGLKKKNKSKAETERNRTHRSIYSKAENQQTEMLSGAEEGSGLFSLESVCTLRELSFQPGP